MAIQPPTKMRFKLLAAGTHGDKSEAPVARNVLQPAVSFAYVFSAPLRLTVKRPLFDQISWDWLCSSKNPRNAARDTGFRKE
jgi:hypothetical protein